mmetsp:Transcript_9271/g.33283  ORF Transcript_9271/g.33283 Transcript_9271/m.33283 type:complete len:274 (+) Transcript_9271:800-1621(+)
MRTQEEEDTERNELNCYWNVRYHHECAPCLAVLAFRLHLRASRRPNLVLKLDGVDPVHVDDPAPVAPPLLLGLLVPEVLSPDSAQDLVGPSAPPAVPKRSPVRVVLRPDLAHPLVHVNALERLGPSAAVTVVVTTVVVTVSLGLEAGARGRRTHLHLWGVLLVTVTAAAAAVLLLGWWVLLLGLLVFRIRRGAAVAAAAGIVRRGRLALAVAAAAAAGAHFLLLFLASALLRAVALVPGPLPLLEALEHAREVRAHRLDTLEGLPRLFLESFR